MASAMSNIGSAVPFIGEHKVLFAVIAILILASINLRGLRESGTAFAIPTYAFMIGMYAHAGVGLCSRSTVLDEPLQAESASFEMETEHGDVLGFALVFLVARAFLVWQRGADRCGGDQQRGAGVPET